MTAIGEAERKTQRRVARLFVDELGYEHLGDLSEADNRNIIEGQLEHFLWAYQGFSERERERAGRAALVAFYDAKRDAAADASARRAQHYFRHRARQRDPE